MLRELEKYPVFNTKKIAELINKNREYARLVAYRLKRKGLITELEKGKYTANKEAFIAASNLVWPSYISGWSALRYHNLTEQLTQNIFVVTTRNRKKRIIPLRDSKIIFIKTKSKYFFGYKKERYDDFEIFIADKEKALIDSALFKKISFSEISEMIQKNIEEIDFDLFFDYLIRMRNKTLIKRFGLLFDKLGRDFYNKARRFINYKYVTLDYSLPERGRKNKKWRVIENVELKRT